MKNMTDKQLAKEIGCTPNHLQKTSQAYNFIAEGKRKDCWGNKFFHNMPLDIKDDPAVLGLRDQNGRLASGV